MKYPKERKLFTIREVARTCGISRTTLIRMEECGFLKPYRIDPQTGYRYYDADNITSIGQYLLLQNLGLSRSEISDVYYQRVDPVEFYRTQRAKLARLTRLLNELELRVDHSKNYTTSFTDLPKLTCYCTDLDSASAEGLETAAYESYGQCIKDGLHIQVTEPLFVIRNDDWNVNLPLQEKSDMTFCIPVSDAADADPHLRIFPATRAFTMISFGDYSHLPLLCKKIWGEIKRRRLTPTGPVRINALMAPYVGSHIKPDDFCGEVIVPVDPLTK